MSELPRRAGGNWSTAPPVKGALPSNLVNLDVKKSNCVFQVVPVDDSSIIHPQTQFNHIGMVSSGTELDDSSVAEIHEDERVWARSAAHFVMTRLRGKGRQECGKVVLNPSRGRDVRPLDFRGGHPGYAGKTHAG